MDFLRICVLIENNFMAEMETTNCRKNAKGFARGVKKSTKVDLTPMVDLVFCLLHFLFLLQASHSLLQ
jgi:biopolymer transport protein ExbD